MIDSIANRIQQHVSELQGFRVRGMWVFGSAARNDPAARDVDILVEFEQPPSLVGFVQLQQLLESILDKPVDLVSKGGCSERFLQRIQGDLQHVA